ncbi:MAG: hypothetical protein GY789_05100 [Hyphomicrobiales bacterium]|nr:hypothetical protein [Hyphomicrobiales bacterium]MCP4998251.1 hypothetical protein [Hyphomicrobiales bacterium]
MDSTSLKFDLPAALSELSSDELEQLANAGDVVKENLRLLNKSGQNLVGQCLAHQGTFYEEEHYPKGDIYDSESHAQYYYHAHRPESGEHGHFHTFLRSAGMPRKVKPAPYSGEASRPSGKDALSHVVAISMNKPGLPIGMFTTNRWVTGETFYRSEDVISMVDRFDIEQSYPCLATNRAISALMRLFRPQVVALLKLRDDTLSAWSEQHPDTDVYEDRKLEITSVVDINIDRQISEVKKARRRARKG